MLTRQAKVLLESKWLIKGTNLLNVASGYSISFDFFRYGRWFF